MINLTEIHFVQMFPILYNSSFCNNVISLARAIEVSKAL